MLIGVGRWGSIDPWLGIPVNWESIYGAKVIIESNFKDINVEPSQGSHFFQNLTSFQVGYFTVNDRINDSYLDKDWLYTQPVAEAKNYSLHIRLEKPLTIIINGNKNQGIILKPD